MNFPWLRFRRNQSTERCAGCPIPGQCGVKRCLAEQLSCSPTDLAELMRRIGPAFVALQNRKATLGSRIDLSESTNGNLALLDAGQLCVDLDRLLAECQLVTVSADQPFLEFDCRTGAERLLIYPEAGNRHTIVSEILSHFDAVEQRAGVPDTVRWLDEFPGNPPTDSMPSSEEDRTDSGTPPLAHGSSLRIRMVTAFADWKKSLRVSSVDHLGNLMVIRGRESVAYCPRLLTPGDHSFSLRLL